MSLVQLPDGTWVRRENVMSIGLVSGAHGDRVRVTVATPVGVTEAFLLPEGEEAPSALRDRVARAVNGSGGLTREEAIEVAWAIEEACTQDGEIRRSVVADILMEHFS